MNLKSKNKTTQAEQPLKKLRVLPILWSAIVAEGNSSRDDILNVAATGSTERKSVACYQYS